MFADIEVFRFMDNVALSADDRKGFQRLLNLIKVLAPVKGRSIAVKQIDFPKTLAYSVTEAGRQRLLAYFEI